ncbi:hypothetical protein MNBD_BACTEROID01-2382 [hydrothermal vent metagenome]|uniref:Thioredoxin-like fold domain-containing protein n=1 Tax=hydrothermal vent metagenome TaxID=652676 RepID=A0A3B0UTH6_9ZZZZ
MKIKAAAQKKMVSSIEIMQKQASPEIIHSENALGDSLYNHSVNGLNYEITFLEFGATGCSACKRMESVMDKTPDMD